MSVRLLVTVGVTSLAGLLIGPLPASTAEGPRGSLQIVQAVPGQLVDVSVDATPVRSGVRAGTVVGPVSLAPGRHVVQFTAPDGGTTLRASVTVRSGSSADVVLHLPASVSGDPVVSTYSTPRKAIGPGKSRVLVAHTATVAPADVRVDGRTIFTNIANGEFAEADVPAGSHEVALLPTGQTTDPILGPIDVDLAPRTVTMVYAFGRPADGSMKVIAHSARIEADGTVAPDTITAGTAGLAADLRVEPFTTAPALSPGG